MHAILIEFAFLAVINMSLLAIGQSGNTGFQQLHLIELGNFPGLSYNLTAFRSRFI